MPYELKQSGDGWKVFKKGTSKSFSKKPLSKAKAKAQMSALYANESFEQKLHNVLIEGIGRGGTEVAKAYIPADYDPNETEVTIEFDWEAPEPRTFNYPGSSGGVQITRIVTDAGKEFNVDQIPDRLREHFEEVASDHLNKKELRAQGDYEDALDARREEEMIRHRGG